jgi:hypothetical protein
MGNHYKHTLAVLKVIEVGSKLGDWTYDSALIEHGAWPTEFETVDTKVVWVDTVCLDGLDEDVPSYEVPKLCADREKWIEAAVERLASQWHNGNRSFVHEELMRMPKGVAIAVTAGLGAIHCGIDLLPGRDLFSGMKERA